MIDPLRSGVCMEDPCLTNRQLHACVFVAWQVVVLDPECLLFRCEWKGQARKRCGLTSCTHGLYNKVAFTDEQGAHQIIYIT
jgi:hypothetical protein